MNEYRVFNKLYQLKEVKPISYKAIRNNYQRADYSFGYPNYENKLGSGRVMYIATTKQLVFMLSSYHLPAK